MVAADRFIWVAMSRLLCRSIYVWGCVWVTGGGSVAVGWLRWVGCGESVGVSVSCCVGALSGLLCCSVALCWCLMSVAVGWSLLVGRYVGRSICVWRCGSVALGSWGSVAMGRLLCWSVAVDWLLCQSAAVRWTLWVGCCGLVLLCWSLCVSCCKSATVGRLLWLVAVSC